MLESISYLQMHLGRQIRRRCACCYCGHGAYIVARRIESLLILFWGSTSALSDEATRSSVTIAGISYDGA